MTLADAFVGGRIYGRIQSSLQKLLRGSFAADFRHRLLLSVRSYRLSLDNADPAGHRVEEMPAQAKRFSEEAE